MLVNKTNMLWTQTVLQTVEHNATSIKYVLISYLGAYCAVEQIRGVNRFIFNLRFFSLTHIRYSVCHVLAWPNCWWEGPSICCQWHRIVPGSIFSCRNVVISGVFSSAFPFHNSNDIIYNALLALQCCGFFPGNWIHMDFGLMSSRKPQVQGAEKSPVKLGNERGPLQNRAFAKTLCPGKHITNVRSYWHLDDIWKQNPPSKRTKQGDFFHAKNYSPVVYTCV